MVLMKKENQTEENVSGWKGIGRSLVIAAVGPESLCEQLHEEHVVVISLEGTAMELARRRALSPDLVDVVVIEATEEDREDKLELSRVLRGRYLSTLLVLPRQRWGKRVFRSHLGIFRHQGRLSMQELWMAVSVAAQQTWALGWTRLDRNRDIKEVRKTTSESEATVYRNTAPKNAGGLAAPDLPRPASDRAPSRTTPWAPPPALLVELTKAYTEER